MKHCSEIPSQTVGVDVGDRHSNLAVVDATGEVVEEGRIPTTPKAFTQRFRGRERLRVAIEVGSHSRWIEKLLEELGHEVVVANARKLKLISQSLSKSDRVDARLLGRLARVDPGLLGPIEHRSEQTHADRLVLKARDDLVRTRASLVSFVRNAVKVVGERLPSCSTRAFAKAVAEAIPATLRPALAPMVETIGDLTRRIHAYDREVERIARVRYPVTEHLRHIAGVGPIASLAFVLTIEDPTRFRSSRTVGSYLGLRPRQSDSGERAPELRVTKAGDGFLRRTLVQSAQYILGPFGPESALREWGQKLASRGKKRAKKTAVVAVARKLAVLLHRLWVTGEVYRPFPQAATAA